MDEIKRTLTNLTKNFTKVSGDLIKTTKINLAISGEEDKLKSVYIDIGKKVHEIYMFGGSIGKFFDEKYVEINEIENKLAGLREQLNIANGTRACPRCKKPVEKSSEFCPKCGAKMDLEVPAVVVPAPVIDMYSAPPIPPAPVIAPIELEVLQANRICGSCGSENDPEGKYCLSCGRMI